MTWKMRTMHSDDEAEHQQRKTMRQKAKTIIIRHPGATADEHHEEEVEESPLPQPLRMVRCGCGALKPTDMMKYIGDLEDYHKAELPHGDDYACDDCFHRMIAVYGNEDVHRCFGMPDEHLEHHRKHDKKLIDNAPHRTGFRRPSKRDHDKKGLDKH